MRLRPRQTFPAFCCTPRQRSSFSSAGLAPLSRLAAGEHPLLLESVRLPPGFVRCSAAAPPAWRGVAVASEPSCCCSRCSGWTSTGSAAGSSIAAAAAGELAAAAAACCCGQRGCGTSARTLTLAWRAATGVAVAAGVVDQSVAGVDQVDQSVAAADAAAGWGQMAAAGGWSLEDAPGRTVEVFVGTFAAVGVAAAGIFPELLQRTEIAAGV
jgi:hypothetical protein